MHEADLTYTKSLVQRGVRCYWMRSLGIRYWVALLVVAVSAVFLSRAPNVATWVLTTLTVSVAVALVFPALLYAAHNRSSMGRFRRMEEPTARFIAEADTFTVSSSIGKAELKWSVVTAIWKCPDLWVIVYERSGFSVLPIASVPQTMRDFIEERVRNAGGKVQ